MRRLILAFAAGALLIASPALAAEGGGKDKGKDKEPTQYVDLQPVGLPVVLNGRLINYIFVSIRIQLTPNANVSKVRTKEPYFRDALVKLGHRTPFTNSKNYMTLDMPRLKSVFGQEANAIAGPGNVKSIDVMAETPQKTSGLPHPDGGKTTTIQP